jgi:hypothetical protein
MNTELLKMYAEWSKECIGRNQPSRVGEVMSEAPIIQTSEKKYETII